MENGHQRFLLALIVLLATAVAVATPAAAQTFTEFPVPTAKSDAYGITTGRDGALWFIEAAATFTASPTSGSAPLHVTFRASGLARAMSYTVNFGDGAAGKLIQNPMPMYLCSPQASNCVNPTPSFSTSHTYASAGAYTATLLNANNMTLAAATITVR